MLFFGHVGLSIGAGKVIEHANKRIDLLFLGIGALFPDIDKIVSFFLFGIGGRAFFHSLLFAIAFTLVALASRRLFMKSFALGVWLHLLFDTMWTFPETLFWPFLGAFNSDAFDAGYAITHFFYDPFILVSEVLGLVILAWFVYKEKLYRTDIIMSKIRKKIGSERE